MKCNCKHCGVEYEATNASQEFCCRGCECVHGLIHDKGLDRYYELKRGSSLPLNSIPYQARDYSWLSKLVDEAEDAPDGNGNGELELELQGISCVGCVWLVEKIFQEADGAVDVVVNVQKGTIRLKWETGVFDVVVFAKTLQKFGYLVGAPGEKSRSAASPLTKKIGLCGAFMLNSMLFTLPRYLGMEDDFFLAGLFSILSAFFATLSLAVGGSYFIQKAWKGVSMGILHIDLPISLGIIFAYTGSWIGSLLGNESLIYFDFVSTFIFLMLVGRWLQELSVRFNRDRINSNDQPNEVERLLEKGPERITVDLLEVGDTISIAPGQTLPVTARSIEDDSTLSLEWINGEPEPRQYKLGQEIPAGAVNLGREPVRLRVREKWEDSLLFKMEQRREETSRNPRFERVLSFYTALVILMAAGGGGFWILASGNYQLALQVCISVLVVSCPCALGISYPLINDRSVRHLQKAGLFIKSDQIWHKLKGIRQVIFDKTGTLTIETPTLKNPDAIESLNQEELNNLKDLIDESYHPICRSLREVIYTGTEIWNSETEIREEVGYGVWKENDGTRWSLGRTGWIPSVEESLEISDSPYDCEFRRSGESVARFQFAEELKNDAEKSIESLQNNGLTVTILSGDRQKKVDRMATLLNMNREFAVGGLTPQEKADWISRNDPDRCLMVGDGVNDKLAFDVAGCCGTPVADKGMLETHADFYFLGSGLSALLKLIAAARKRENTLKIVFAFAVTYNLVAVAFCLSGLMNPLLAAILMPLSSIATLGLSVLRKAG